MERRMMQQVDYGETAKTAPSSCPACRSTDVCTTSKTIDEATYWRCRACGEVWNASRRRPTEPPRFRR
jgi:ribosomal protein L37AE/L43A